MRIVLGTHHLIAPAGADTYLLTVSRSLQRLGHDVTIYALELGPLADRARQQGFRVVSGRGELPDSCEAILTQDQVTAYDLAERYPTAPHVFVCHSDLFSIDTPPAIPDVVRTIAAMSDRISHHVESLPAPSPVARLRQPIDLDHFSPSGRARQRPRRVVAISNYLEGPRLGLLRQVCEEERFELDVWGGRSRILDDPRQAMGTADIVVGKGRVVLEGMASGRAALVYDSFGFGGWMTAGTYAGLESDGFLGRAAPLPATKQQLRDALRAYDPDMGTVNRDLVHAHHDAADHAQAMLGLFAESADPPKAHEPMLELSLLARRHWLVESSLFDARRRIGALEGELGALEGELEHQVDRSDQAELTARQALKALDEIKQSRRYRLAERLAALQPTRRPRQ